MSTHKKYQFIVIGAGIMGLSVVKELTTRFPKAKIALIEKERTIGLHASGRNSGVLHSGIYYPKDSMKAAVCAKGAERMIAFAHENKIPYQKNGKIIIATKEADLPTLDFLLKNASNNKIEAYRLDEQEIKKIEPYASPFQFGIQTPSTASIDSKAVLKKCQDIILSRGVDLYLDQPVIHLDNNNTLLTSREKFHYDFLFNCAGAQTDKIAKMAGLGKEYQILPFKGIYYQLKKEKSYLVNSHIYPVPDLNLPFLGVHFTRTIDGTVYVGPTAIPAFGRENYGLLQGITTEVFRIVKDIALMYTANHQNFRGLMHSEIKKYMKPFFIKTARKLISEVKADDLIASHKVGIRPQLINVAKKKIEMDYIVLQESHSIHVLNAISPAFTGAFFFAELLVNRM